jgi:hypothetical protein
VLVLYNITMISICIYQNHTYFIYQGGYKRRVTDSIPVTNVLSVPPGYQPQLVSLPFIEGILGRFTSPEFRISHTLRLVFHRKGFYPKLTWDEDVEIFQIPRHSLTKDVATPPKVDFEMEKTISLDRAKLDSQSTLY